MVDRIEGIHPGNAVGDRAGDGQSDIGCDSETDHLQQMGHRLAGDVGGFGPKKLHAAGPEDRQQQNSHYHDTDAAEPLQQGAPQQ
jgi:hypothetical protein